MKRQHIIYIIAAVMSVISCERYDMDEILLHRDDISMTIKGSVILTYDTALWQLGYNASRNEYRVHDDKMEDYFILKCSEKLSHEGQEVKADLTYATAGNVRQETGLNFSVEKNDGASGRFWLWNKSRKIGIVIQEL